jgi:hypothetical protein
MELGTQTGRTGIERKAWEDSLANRRKPRVYASFEFGSDKCLYPLDFCFWLHRNFDGLVEAINTYRLFEYDTW